MPFQPGNKLAPGRKKGSKNIYSLRVLEKLSQMKNEDGSIGFDPIRELVECYHRCANTDGVMHVAVKCLDVLMPYCYAKKTSEELMGPSEVAMIEQIRELAKKPKQEIIDVMKSEIKKLDGK